MSKESTGGMEKQNLPIGGEQTEKQKAAEAAVSQIKERFGEGSIMKLGEAKRMEVGAVPTGCLSLDLALGVGGVPRGRIIEIFGPEASGKTTLAQHVVAEVQKLGGMAAFVDAEHALDPDYAKKIGIDINNMLISQPDTGEQALEIVETLVRSNGVDVIVVDSVAALVPKAEIEGEMGDSHMGFAGAADEPGPAQTGRHYQQDQNRGDFHQPDQDENRRLFRQSGNHHRRHGFEILFFSPD